MPSGVIVAFSYLNSEHPEVSSSSSPDICPAFVPPPFISGNKTPPENKKNPEPLLGAIFDLYRMATYMQEIGITPLILTDIRIRDVNYRMLAKFASREEARSDILDFPREYIRDTNIRTKKDLVKALEDLPWEDDTFFFYYSGHGLRDALLLPDRSQLPISNLLLLLEQRRKRFFRNPGQIFLLLDCCDIPNMDLSFQFHPSERRFRLNPKLCTYTSDHFLLLRSTTPEGIAGSTRFGSLFTRALIRFLSTRLRSPVLFSELMEEVTRTLEESYKLTTSTTHKQEIFISCSRNIGNLLWGWLTDSPVLQHPTHPHIFLLKTQEQEEKEERKREEQIRELQERRSRALGDDPGAL